MPGMSNALYIEKEPPSAGACAELSEYDTLTQRLLAARNIKTLQEAELFFDRNYEEGLHDPFLLPDMDTAVSRILQAIKEGEKIAIFSDYDCDGIPGGALLHDFFKMIGYTNFYNYIPHRHYEGYGMSTDSIDTILKEGARLMITVDCGITNLDEVAYAEGLGISVIVTDHHEPKEILPNAHAVINPKRKDSIYPFTGLCGTGVAFKLICGLLERGGFSITKGQEKWLLDLVGIATIADMVPLIDENRIFAHYGLLVLRKGKRLGLSHLFRIMKIPLATVTEDDIGFMVAPRINAASRMGNPHDAFQLLIASEEADAGAHAHTLDRINNERKGVVLAMVKEAKHMLSLRSGMGSVIVVGDPSWRPSLVGLVANTLSEEYARPVFVWGRDGNGILKGSCRSGGTSSVVTIMEKAAHAFIEFGGHHMSGGFSVKEEYIHTLSSELESARAELSLQGSEDVRSELYEVDAILSLDEVTRSLAKTLDRFAPYGEGNTKPLFVFPCVTPSRVEIFGKQKAHTKILFKTNKGMITAIGFFSLPHEYAVPLQEEKPFDLIAHVEESFFMGRSELRLRIVAALPVSSPQK